MGKYSKEDMVLSEEYIKWLVRFINIREYCDFENYRYINSEKNNDYIASIDTFYNLIKRYALYHGIKPKNEKHLLAAYRVSYTSTDENNNVKTDRFLINFSSKSGVSCEIPKDKDIDAEGFISFNDVMLEAKKWMEIRNILTERRNKLIERISNAKSHKGTAYTLTRKSSN